MTNDLFPPGTRVRLSPRYAEARRKHAVGLEPGLRGFVSRTCATVPNSCRIVIFDPGQDYGPYSPRQAAEGLHVDIYHLELEAEVPALLRALGK